MLNYTFSKREKVLLLILALILLGLLWFMLVWQGAENEKLSIDGEIAEAEAQILVANTKMGKQAAMQDAIAAQKKAGAKAANLPAFDNTTALMAQLNKILGATTDYKLSFDDLDYSQEGVVARGVTITFGCDSIEAGRSVMTQLESGQFACTIDSATISSTDKADNRSTNARVGVNTGRTTTSPYAVGLHVVFYEKL